jgi:AraC family transcriptional regulator, transcriptional activator of the genes for pyochelin and ferripyochelin receptors
MSRNPEIVTAPSSGADVPQGLSFEQVSLRPGLQLILANFTPNRSLQFTMETREVPYEFAFHLAGRPRYRVVHADGEKRFAGVPGLMVASAFPHAQATMEIPEGEPVRLVAIHLSPVFFQGYLRDNDAIPDWPELREALACGEFPFCFRSEMTDPAMALVASQLLDCPYRGVTRQLFYESRILDLIARQMAGLCSKIISPDLKGFSPVELEGLREVRNCVFRSLDKPPGIFELARLAGMNHVKLNRGFKALFGTTVFGYLRHCRLEESCRLMEKGEMSLSEIAYAAGFSSPSHFARAFSLAFGFQPSAYMKNRMSRKTVSLPSLQPGFKP